MEISNYQGIFGALVALFVMTFLPGYALLYSMSRFPFSLSSVIFVSIALFIFSLAAVVMTIIVAPMHRRKLNPRLVVGR